jgi:DMSO/TMAO reductase YedYZ molybdopterin-dependent catalytic subunit
VLSAGPTPGIDLAAWELVITSETDTQRRWDWKAFRALPTEQVTVDLYCVTHWSKLHTTWEGVSLDTLLEGLETSAGFALVTSWGGYTTNLPLEDLTDHKAWIAFRYDGAELEAEHGGPARLLVPHLYLWKSAKWVRGSSCWTRTSRAFGRAWATTTTATPGRSSGPGATEDGGGRDQREPLERRQRPRRRPLPGGSRHRRRPLRGLWAHRTDGRGAGVRPRPRRGRPLPGL